MFQVSPDSYIALSNLPTTRGPMTQHEFAELKSLIQANAQGISGHDEKFDELKSLIQANAQGISRNYEMIGRIYEEHGGRLTRVEVGQEQLSDDLRAVAEGVTGNAERLDRLDPHRSWRCPVRR